MFYIVHTVIVPVQPTTLQGTNPTVYGTVKTPGRDGITFVIDPMSGTPIDETNYEEVTLKYARQHVAEAIRACAINPCVVDNPPVQVSYQTAANTLTP